MSTESETKSAGVPAGATHVCLLCGQYWMLAWQMVGGESDPDCGCEDDLRSIAETGPAPTTAAPAEPPVNQCDGCRAGLPIVDGAHHYPDGRIHQACTRDRYAAPAEQLSGKVVCAGEHMAADCHLPLTPTEPGNLATAVRAIIEKNTLREISGWSCAACHDHREDKDGGRAKLHWPGCPIAALDKLLARPAEQPGKAADPRPGEVLCDKPSYKHGGSHPQKATCVDPRPAQPRRCEVTPDCARVAVGTLRVAGTTYRACRECVPDGWRDRFTADGCTGDADCEVCEPAQTQAPAEPTKEQIEKATAVVANLWGPKSLHVALVGKIAAALAAEAAPLREERDRLAGQLVGMTGERDDERKISQEWEEKAEAAEKAVAERDARIATLTKAIESVPHALTCPVFSDPRFAECNCWKRAALGAPEGQPRYGRFGPCNDCGGIDAHNPHCAPEGQPPVPQRYLGNDVTCSDATVAAPQELLGKEGAAADDLREARELINDLLGLLADHRDHTLKLAMQHGYDLDDVESFRLTTRCNEMQERLARNKAGLLAQRAAPPRKAPQEDAAAKLASVREYVAYMFDPASLDELHMRGTFAAGVWKCIRPSSPEEQPPRKDK